MRIKSLVVLSLVCSLSQAADTVASLGDSIKATQFVTAVDHTKLVNGTTEVIANDNGTASISTSQSVQKPNCVRVSQADGSTGKTIVLSFRQTSEELESWGSSWPGQLEFTIEYDGVSYDAVTVGETLTDGREVSTSLAWMNGSMIYPSGIYSSTSWSGALYEFESPGGLDLIGDGNGESCSTYTYTEQSAVSRTVATVDQIPSVSGYIDAQTATNIVTGAVPAWARSNKKPTYSYSEIQSRPNSIGGFVVVTNVVGGEVGGLVLVYPEHEQEGIFVVPNEGIELVVDHDGELGWSIGIGLSKTNDFASKAWVNNQGYVPASTATNIAKQIIRNAVSGVNTDIQSAEDARVALTNLITILKNL